MWTGFLEAAFTFGVASFPIPKYTRTTESWFRHFFCFTFSVVHFLYEKYTHSNHHYDKCYDFSFFSNSLVVNPFRCYAANVF